jgi:hypothetical protein
MQPTRRLRILLCGAFGYGNLGDDLVRDAASDVLSQHFGESIELYVDRLHPNRTLIDYVDLRIIGPGGLLYDTVPQHSAYFREYLKPPYILMGIGMGFNEVTHPYPKCEPESFTWEALYNADLIMTRHQQDVPVIEKVRGSRDNVYVIPDFGFFYTPRFQLHTQRGDKPFIAICPAGLGPSQKDDFIHSELAAQVDAIIALSDEDRPLVEAVAQANQGVRTTYDYYHDSPEFLAALIGSADLVISGRFYGIILGMRAGVPVMGLCHQSGRFTYKINCLDIPRYDYTAMGWTVPAIPPPTPMPDIQHTQLEPLFTYIRSMMKTLV